ncbi:bZIP transcription factor [Aspergillus tubingensis]|uniref:BZIP domain-containing protein n=1 Tax=Aspergillus niger TaxID=5061 RepID=A0A117E2F5_ASPNG|nr:probable S-adenosylmethionine-dependent methyltransferase CRG1 [Aspergillus tubingensis]GAQ45548.1 hypothetical protein AOR_1_186164 [Aspergillus niger]GFN20255.1 probable S-adenosylmethionine-dependent methyltransferase CRG1 [Aspergillus tubingensis]
MANSTNLSHGDRVGCTPGLPEVRSAEEDWTGLTDPALRRKLQNRLNQRIYRQRRRAKPAANTSELDINPATTERAGNSLASEDQCERIEQERTNAVASREESEDALASPKSSIQPPTSIHQMSRAEILQIMAQYEAKARKDYALGSPRVDQLLTLIQFNVFRALVDNTSALGFTMDWLDEEAMSPWCASVSDCRIRLCPISLRPTSLQKEIPHHPWIDLFPIPKMRDNLLQRYGNFDEAALCNDLVDFYDVTNDETCLIVWTTPWHPTGWEVSETFLRKWNWVLRGCDDLAKSTNYWRRLRGEEPLNFDYGLQ